MTQIKDKFKDKKLIVISRRDLPPGVQSAQSTHAAIDFIFDHPEIALEWHKNSNYLVQLSVKDESELLSMVEKLDRKGIVCTKFHEPDLDNELTSISLEPSRESRRVTSNLPLLLKEFNKKEEEICTE